MASDWLNEQIKRSMGVNTYISTYQNDYSKSQTRGRSRSFSAMPMHKPSSGVIPTAGRPATKYGPEVMSTSGCDEDMFDLS